jgi:HlyD family secretion protein
MNRVVLAAPPVALLVLFAYWKIALSEPVQYYTAKVEKGDVAQVVQSTGTINAVTTVQVGSQVSGIIAEIFVDFNMQVKKGQVIAQIDPSILRARLQQSEADLMSAQANVKNIEAQIETQRADLVAAQAGVDRARASATEAELNLKRTKELFEQGIVAASMRDTVQATYDGAVAGLKVAEAQVEQSRARLRSMQASLEQAKAQVAQRRAATEMSRVDLGHAVITAPIDGTVIARNVDVGQTVAASLQAPTLFIIAQDLTKMLVYAKTDEADVGKIKPGAMATFRVDSFPREVFRGKVIQVRMNATTVQNVVTYDTIIEFENPERKLFPGMTATVTIPVEVASDVVKIPNGALRFRPEMSDDERREILAKHGIEETLAQRGRPAGGVGAAAGGQQAGAGMAAGNSSGGERRMGAGSQEGGRPSAAGAGRGETGIVWKLVNKKDLVPVQVRLGVTDFTFREMKEGDLKPCLPGPAQSSGAGKNEPCDELVIGQSNNRSSSPPANRPPGMGGPPGGMRRM